MAIVRCTAGGELTPEERAAIKAAGIIDPDEPVTAVSDAQEQLKTSICLKSTI